MSGLSLVLDTLGVEEKPLAGLSSVCGSWVSNFGLLALEVGCERFGVHGLITEPEELL